MGTVLFNSSIRYHPHKKPGLLPGEHLQRYELMFKIPFQPIYPYQLYAPL